MTLGHPGADRPGDRPDAPPGDPVEAHGNPADGAAVDSVAVDSAAADRAATGTGSSPAGHHPAHRRKPRLSFMQELPFLVVAALVLAIIIKAFVVQAFYIPSDSMERTLHGCTGCHGDRVMVNKLAYKFHDIHRGDIVVFDGKDNYQDRVTTVPESGNPVRRAIHHVADWIGLAPEGTDYIKRVIGLPGDVVACCDDSGRVTVNGHALVEPYVYIDQPGYSMQFQQVRVPQGRVFVMGDHRNDSYDSRVAQVGSIPTNDVIGRAFVTIWPPSRWRWLSQPETFHNWPTNTAAG